jgi:hypothetical protein
VPDQKTLRGIIVCCIPCDTGFQNLPQRPAFLLLKQFGKIPPETLKVVDLA